MSSDYKVTARAIAENIGILPKNSDPNTQTIDCQVIRVIAQEVDKCEAQLSALKAEPTKPHDYESQVEHLSNKAEEHLKRIDAITARADVYARAQPVDKITIVRSLQRQGHVCSMTGDGVNDGSCVQFSTAFF